MLNLSGEQLTGHVLGRVVSAQARLSIAERPCAGVYRVLPPRAAPVLGTVVVAIPAMHGPTNGSISFTDMMMGSAVYPRLARRRLAVQRQASAGRAHEGPGRECRSRRVRIGAEGRQGRRHHVGLTSARLSLG